VIKIAILQKSGGTYSVYLDKILIKFLGWEKGDEVYISRDGASIRIDNLTKKQREEESD